MEPAQPTPPAEVTVPEAKPVVVVVVEDCPAQLPEVVEAVVAHIAQTEKVPTVVGPMTREAWLIAGVEQMTPMFKSKGYEVPKLRVSCGWPSIKGLSAKSRRIGECWAAEASTDGVHQIFISPFLDQKVTPGEVLATLVHEVVHAVVGLDKKHGKEFRKCALAVGLDGKMTATFAGPELLAHIEGWEKQLGPYPHASLDALKRPTKKQTARMLKAECKECGYTARLTKKWIEEVGWPHCPKHGAMHGELPTDETKEDSSDEND